MRLNKLLQMLAERTQDWAGNGTSARFKRPVQIKTLADLSALGDELALGGQVRYQVNGYEKSLEEIAVMSDIQLREIAVIAYGRDVTPSGFANFKSNVILNNQGYSHMGPGPGYMVVHVSMSPCLHAFAD